MGEDDRQLFEDSSRQFHEAMEEIKEEREAYWNSLTKEQQLMAFCAVVERIVDAEEDGRSYRGVLYGEFGFGTEAYGRAQMSGFLTLHNSYMNQEAEKHLLRAFANSCGIEDPEQAIRNYYGLEF